MIPEASELRMAAIFRADLPHPAGKMAAQAGHAFLTAWRQSRDSQPVAAEHYAEASQAKLVILAPDEACLRKIAARAEAKHHSLESTIAHPGDDLTMRPAMACHETNDAHCIGWRTNSGQATIS